MSSPMMRYARGGRRRKGGVPDLNVPPPVETNLEQTGETIALVDQVGGLAISGAHDVPVVQIGSAMPAPIVVDDLEDDVVIISSPRAIEEAKNKPRRSRPTHVAEAQLVFDLESGVTVVSHGHAQVNKRRRGPTNPSDIECELLLNIEGSSASRRAQPRYVAPPPPPPPPPPPEPTPTFACPICMGPFADEVTTKCGHIFCKACIEPWIRAQHKCPTCRRKLTNKNFFRVYLPTTK